MTKEDEKDIARPMRWPSFIATRPCTVLMALLFVTIVLSAVAFMAKDFVVNDGNFESRDTYETRMNDAKSMLSVHVFDDDANVRVDEKLSIMWPTYNVYVFYRVADDEWMDAQNAVGVFDPAFLSMIERVDRLMYDGLEDYGEHCWKPFGPSKACMSPVSVADLFKLNGTDTFGDVSDILANLSRPELLDGGSLPFGFFVDREFTTEKPVSRLTRSMHYLGYPLEGYTSGGRAEIDPDEDFLEQRLTQDTYFLDHVRPLLDDIAEDAAEIGLEVTYFNMGFLDWSVMQFMLHDVTFILIGMLFIAIVFYVHMRSFYLACMGVLSIILPFPVGYFFYAIVFGYDIFPMINIMALFMVLGIGADDLFVMFDAWQQSEYMGAAVNASILTKAAYTFKRSAMAMLVTSLTTLVAFLSNYLTPCPSIEAVGIFAALLVILSYLFVISWFFAALMSYVLYIQYWRKKNYPSWHPSYVASASLEMKTMQAPQKVDVENVAGATPEVATADVIVSPVPESKEREFDYSKLGRIERYYHDKLSIYVFKSRFIILALALVLLVVCTWQASTMEQGTSNPDPFPAWSMIGKTRNYMYESMRPSASSGVEVAVTWGALDINRDGIDPNDKTRLGDVVWDTEFRYETVDDQQSVYKLLQTLVNNNELVPGSSDYTVIGAFREWRASNGETRVVADADELVADMYFFTRNIWQRPADVGFYSENGKKQIRWISVPFNSSLNFGIPPAESKAIAEKWRSVVSEWVANDNPAKNVQNAVVSSGAFSWAVAMESMVDVAIVNIFTSVGIAYLVLLVSSGNIISSTYAICTIGLVVVVTMSITILLGWTLGFIEALCLTLMVGISVDYVVHLSEAFVRSPFETRMEKMKQSFTEMGVSVIGSWLTTVGAAALLIPTYITVFPQIGIFVVICITLSFLFAHTVFPALCFVIGPTGHTGNVIEMVKQRTLFPK